jgi:hypothetical protein
MIDYPVYFLVSESFLQRNPPKTTQEDWRPFGDWPSLMHLLSVCLAEAGLPVQTVSALPDRGVVIGHTGDLNFHTPPPLDVYLVCYQGDWERSLWANEHIVSNHYQACHGPLTTADRIFGVGPRYHLPFIPEPQLTPRALIRADRFENIAYMGTPYNLIPELQTAEWNERLSPLGLKFHVEADVSKQGDYSQVDAIVAVRPENRNPKQKFANKLWNAWRAGVPAILGPEPGFQEKRKSDLDYIEARNADAVYEALQKLARNPALRQAMVANGFARCGECSREALVQEWVNHLRGPMRETYLRWIKSPPWLRTLDREKRLLRHRIKSLRKQASRYISSRGT